MANEQNLIPNSNRTPNELREITKKGGKASGEARRQKKDLRLAFEALLEQDVTSKGLDGKEELVSGADAIAIAQFKKALKGDSKAFEVVRDTSGQIVTQKIEVTQIEREQSLQELKDLFEDDE